MLINGSIICPVLDDERAKLEALEDEAYVDALAELLKGAGTPCQLVARVPQSGEVVALVGALVSTGPAAAAAGLDAATSFMRLLQSSRGRLWCRSPGYSSRWSRSSPR